MHAYLSTLDVLFILEDPISAHMLVCFQFLLMGVLDYVIGALGVLVWLGILYDGLE